jgi:hypothetical protein
VGGRSSGYEGNATLEKSISKFINAMVIINGIDCSAARL